MGVRIGAGLKNMEERMSLVGLLVLRGEGKTDSEEQEGAIRRQIAAAVGALGAIQGGMPVVCEVVGRRLELKGAVESMRRGLFKRGVKEVRLYVLVLAPEHKVPLGAQEGSWRSDMAVSIPDAEGGVSRVEVVHDVLGPVFEGLGSEKCSAAVVWDAGICETPIYAGWTARGAAAHAARLRAALEEYGGGMSVEFYGVALGGELDQEFDGSDEEESSGVKAEVAAYYDAGVPRLAESFFRALGESVRGRTGFVEIDRGALAGAVDASLERAARRLSQSRALRQLRVRYNTLYESHIGMSTGGPRVEVSRYALPFIEGLSGARARGWPSATAGPADTGMKRAAAWGVASEARMGEGRRELGQRASAEEDYERRKVFDLKTAEARPGERLEEFEERHGTFRGALMLFNPWLRKWLGERNVSAEARFPERPGDQEELLEYAQPLLVTLPRYEGVLLRAAAPRDILAFSGLPPTEYPQLLSLNEELRERTGGLFSALNEELPAGTKVVVPYSSTSSRLELNTETGRPHLIISLGPGVEEWLMAPVDAYAEEPLFSGPIVLPKTQGGRLTTDTLRTHGYPIPDMKNLTPQELERLGTEGIVNQKFPVQRWCCFCWTDVSGNDNWEKHMVGEKHRKKVSHLMSTVLPSSQQQPGYFSSAPAPQAHAGGHQGGMRLADLDTRYITSIGPYPGPELDAETKRPKCLLCNVILDGISWPKHAAGHIHQMNVRREEESYGGAKAQYVCLACTAQISGIENLRRHLNGIRHQKKLALCAQEDRARTGSPRNPTYMPERRGTPAPPRPDRGAMTVSEDEARALRNISALLEETPMGVNAWQPDWSHTAYSTW